MIPPVEAVSLSAGAATPPPETVERRIVSEQDVTHFEAALSNPAESWAPVEIRSPELVMPQRPLSDVLLNMVEEVRATQAGHMDRIQDMTGTTGEIKPMEMRDLFNLQFELMQLTMQTDLTAKVADRLSQGVQTLFRNQ